MERWDVMSGETNGVCKVTVPTLELWQEYKRTGDRRHRDRIVLTLAPMVRYIVYKKLRSIPSHCEAEDFVSCGLEALIRSIDRYDPSKGASLESFAWKRVTGAVLDELRQQDWAPRSLRKSEREINHATEAFALEHGRAPSRAEISAMLGISEAEFSQRVADIARAGVESLNVCVAGEDDTSIERIDVLASNDPDNCPEQRVLTADAIERVGRAIALLPPRERHVVKLLNSGNLTLREVGSMIGVSESRVSQIHTQIRKRLRELLAADQQVLVA
jgi:RNA polymerase sigma factor for flagellar operon FliA